MTEFGFVYMFFENSTEEKPVYIGYTSNPWQRMSNHFKENASGNGKLCKDAYSRIHFIKLAHVGSEQKGREIESILIYANTPKYNTDIDIVLSRNIAETELSKIKWFTFTKEEFLRDRSIVFRCLNDGEQLRELRREIHILNERLYKAEDELQRNEGRINVLNEDVEFYKKRYSVELEMYAKLSKITYQAQKNGFMWKDYALKLQADGILVRFIKKMRGLYSQGINAEASS